jgi:DNA-binding SARP family transcriptional activator/tetratricopeptide (TPR) repeat protein
LEFRVLGPLEVLERGRRLPLPGAKQRALLAVLCLHANEVVSSDRLIDALWADDPPQSPQAALQYHVSQLRKLLGPERIETRPPGYVLRLSGEELDLARFERLHEEARFAEALALWRGPALADFEYTEFARGEIARLEELRLAALEERIEADLEHGRHAEVVGELEALVHAQPLRERPRARLMLALYRCGRQAEALALYKDTRELLVGELGIEPGEELQQLERQILNQDPSLLPVEEEPEPAAPAAPREERKVVTALVCELRGATVADPEDLRALLAPLHVRLRAELERHGGTVEQVVGNAVVAAFGAPVAHEDDPDRAVRAALAVRDWIAEQPTDVQVRIGIGTGEALVRLDPGPDGGEGTAAGEVVNTAGRLQQAAPPGAVLVGESTYRATKDSIAYEQLAPLEAENGAEPLPVWLATKERRRLDAEPRGPSPFVGRDDDVAVLQSTFLRTLRDSSLQLVTVVGEPGIGKTRLVGEFRTAVETGPQRVLWRQGRCLSYGEGITFWALGEIVKTHAGILESDTPERAESKLAAAVDVVAEEADRAWLRARLGPLVGLRRDEQPVEQEEVFAAWRTFLERVAERQPLVVVVEDLHWADSALLAFLEHLVDWSLAVPMLVVGTARPELYERQPGWGGGKRNSTTISLAPLGERDTTRLIAALLSNAALPPETQATLLERCGGNPLYAEEFARMLVDRGLLRRRNGATEVAGGAAIPVPETVQAVIAARIDTLPPDRKALLHDASVVGKVFWAGSLASMGRIPKESALQGLHELVRKELVRRARSSAIADDVEYAFWHVLVRDVAYGQIPRGARAKRHIAAAEWIERIAGERVTDYAEFLAHHYATAIDLRRAAGDPEDDDLRDRAVRFLLLAGDRADRLETTKGEPYYRQALELMPPDHPERPRALIDAARSAMLAGANFDEIERDFGEALVALRSAHDDLLAGRALTELAFTLWTKGEPVEERLRLLEEARRLLERREPSRELVQAYLEFCTLYGVTSRHKETLSWVDRAWPLAERLGLDEELLWLRMRRASARYALGDRGGVDELKAVAREAGNAELGYSTHLYFRTLNNVADATLVYEGIAPALEVADEAVEFARRRGQLRPAMWVRASFQSIGLYALGQWDELLQLCDEIADWDREHGETQISIRVPPFAALALAHRGELSRAGDLVREFLPRTRKAGPQSHIPALAAALVVETARGDLEAAVALVDELERTTRECDDDLRTWFRPDALRTCVRAGALELAERFADPQDLEIPVVKHAVVTGEAILAEAKGDLGAAERLYADAAARWETYGHVLEHAYALLGLGRCRLALGRATEAEAPLHQARTILTNLGASMLVAEADELLASSG